MNSAAHARTAYVGSGVIAETARGTEYRAFAQVTSRLSKVAENADTQFPQLAEAIYRNGQLWRILATDVAADGNRLPDSLRARIISLAAFSLDHGKKVLRGQATVGPLIDINMAIMRGLRGTAQEG